MEFLNEINNVTSLNRKNTIKIKAPLIELSKKLIIIQELLFCMIKIASIYG